MKAIRAILRNTYIELGVAVAATVFCSSMIYHYAGTVKDTQANASAIGEVRKEQSVDRTTINGNLEKLNEKVDKMGKDVSKMSGILEHWGQRRE